MKNGNFLKMRVSEIRVKQIRVNQGLGVPTLLLLSKVSIFLPGKFQGINLVVCMCQYIYIGKFRPGCTVS